MSKYMVTHLVTPFSGGENCKRLMNKNGKRKVYFLSLDLPHNLFYVKYLYLRTFWGFLKISAPFCIFKLKILSLLGIFLTFFDFE